ncbi:MAG: transporter substrate-binding domain-containing protein [Clostridia bacterium]|nr:transporter substrate-binding domain-containing protein [Clostridia bacterium]
METKINKKLPKGERRPRRSDWQERLPIKPILLGAVVLILLAALILLNGSSGSLLNSPEIEVLKSRGSLRIGVDENVAGLYRNGEGYERDLAELIGETIFNADDCVTLVPVNRHTALMSIEDGDVDMLLMSLTGVSDNGYAQSAQPFFAEDCVLMCMDASLDLEGASVAVLQNTPSYDLLCEYEANVEPELIIVRSAAYYDMLLAFRAGRVDALCMPRSVAETYKDINWVIYPRPVGTLYYYAVAASSNKVLLELIDELIIGWAQDETLIDLQARHGLR